MSEVKTESSSPRSGIDEPLIKPHIVSDRQEKLCFYFGRSILEGRIQGRIGENAVVEISSKAQKRGKSEIARDGREGEG